MVFTFQLSLLYKKPFNERRDDKRERGYSLAKERSLHNVSNILVQFFGVSLLVNLVHKFKYPSRFEHLIQQGKGKTPLRSRASLMCWQLWTHRFFHRIGRSWNWNRKFILKMVTKSLVWIHYNPRKWKGYNE
jgi:hypothetical protein